MSDVDASRLEKAEARSRAREAERARIASENRENEKRKAAVGACAVVKLSEKVEAQRAARAAERSADKEAKVCLTCSAPPLPLSLLAATRALARTCAVCSRC